MRQHLVISYQINSPRGKMIYKAIGVVEAVLGIAAAISCRISEGKENTVNDAHKLILYIYALQKMFIRNVQCVYAQFDFNITIHAKAYLKK